MSQHPTQGVAGSKPRLPKIAGNGQPTNKAEMQRLSREYLAHRNRQMEAKAFWRKRRPSVGGENCSTRGELQRKSVTFSWRYGKRF